VLTCGCRPLEFAGAVAEKKAGDPAELVLDSGFVVPDANAFGNTFRSPPQFILLDRVRVFRGLATRNRSGRQQHAKFYFSWLLPCVLETKRDTAPSWKCNNSLKKP
jgi:hypothetical protein